MDFNIIKATPYLFKCFAELIFLTRFRHISFRFTQGKVIQLFLVLQSSGFFIQQPAALFQFASLVKSIKTFNSYESNEYLRKSVIIFAKTSKSETP